MEELRKRLEVDQSDVGKILRALFLPKIYGDEFRLASEGAGMKSAAANMSVNYSSASWDTATADNQIPASDLMGFLFGNALRAFILFEHNPTGAQSSYALQNLLGTGSVFTLPQFVDTEIVPRYAIPNSAYQPHGAFLFPGYDEAGHFYIWVDNGTAAGNNSLDVDLNAGPATTNGMITWWRWDGKHAVRHDLQQFVVAQQTYTSRPPVGGAYMFASVYNQDANVTSCQVTANCTQGIWGHHPVSDITTLMTNAFGIRVNSATVKVQNNASFNNKNGDFTTVTVSKSLPWCQIASGAQNLSNLQNYRDRPADNGYFGVILPDSDEDVSEFYDDIAAGATRASTINQFAYPLSERRPYKAIGLTVPIAAGRSFTWDVTHTIEYITNNKLVGQGVSQCSEDSVKAAIVIASTMETDYENPSHWKDIVATIGKYIPGSLKALTTGLRIFGFEDPASFLEKRAPLIDEFGNQLRSFKKKKSKR
jgi:hypothetical protein